MRLLVEQKVAERSVVEAENNIDLKGLNHKRNSNIAKQKAQEKEIKEIEQQPEPGMVRMENPTIENAPEVREIDIESNDKDEMHKTFKDLFKKFSNRISHHAEFAKSCTQRNIK